MSTNQAQKPYKVLATKYRPRDFDSLVGQDVLVRTLTNAINAGRIPNAFVLTGIRGVGKTTTARIIARALNCIGEDGKGGATIKPCGVCSNCTSIMEDRNPDVIEMDAASRTGVDNMREVIDNTHYMPVSSRYKIYIIDEVHMLSKSAFNALLKTLEEPPAHVKFIFATTEIRKIPVTILSRCMRFDLKRIEGDDLATHLGNIAAKENVAIEREALQVIAASSEGSVRDALSLLDQVIAHSGGEVKASLVHSVLGLADKSKIIELFETLAKGDVAACFGILRELYINGGDPTLIIGDLLEFTYLVTRVKAAPGLAPDSAVPQAELAGARILAEKLDMAYLTSLWQMLLKGQEEVKIAPNSFAAAEMIMVRVAYMSDLPAPAKVIKDIVNGESLVVSGVKAPQIEQYVPVAPVNSVVADVVNYTLPTTHHTPELTSFEQMVELFKSKGEVLLYNWLVGNVRPVKFEAGRVEFAVCESLPSDFSARISEALNKWTGVRWVVVISKQQGQPTMQEIKKADEAKLKEEISKTPDVSKVLEMFPGAVVEKVEG